MAGLEAHHLSSTAAEKGCCRKKNSFDHKNIRGLLDQTSVQHSASYLVLSEDLTCVRHDDAEQLLPATPERFDCSVSVLGCEGFTSGKHYWEVKVGNKTKWTLGVVKESISRKGSYPLSSKAGHWLIKLRNKSDLKALDIPPRCLAMSSPLCRVGVYLDYEGGQVSFYDASKLIHIYTFADTFAEKLYPYFCPCLNDSGENGEPLKIVTYNM